MLDVQYRFGQGLEQPGQMESVPTHGRGGMGWSVRCLPTQSIAVRQMQHSDTVGMGSSIFSVYSVNRAFLHCSFGSDLFS